MKMGDKVRCIDNMSKDNQCTHALTLGKEYEVIVVEEGFINVVNDNDIVASYFKERFELINEEVEKMNNEFIVGDKALCIDALDADCITEGKVYEVLVVDDSSITIEDDRGIPNPFIKNRFNPIEHIKTYEGQTIIDATGVQVEDSEGNTTFKIESDGSIDPKWFVDNREPVLSTTVEDMQGCANVADAITEDVQVIDFKPMVNVLGTEYTVEIVSEEDDAYLNGIYGYCDFLTKSIVLKDLDIQGYQGNIDALNAQYRINLRHELMHAFLYESGLDSSTLDGWARNEEMIDFMALQLPKIAKVMQDCKIL